MTLFQVAYRNVRNSQCFIYWAARLWLLQTGHLSSAPAAWGMPGPALRGAGGPLGAGSRCGSPAGVQPARDAHPLGQPRLELSLFCGDLHVESTGLSGPRRTPRVCLASSPSSSSAGSTICSVFAAQGACRCWLESPPLFLHLTLWLLSITYSDQRARSPEGRPPLLPPLEPGVPQILASGMQGAGRSWPRVGLKGGGPWPSSVTVGWRRQCTQSRPF